MRKFKINGFEEFASELHDYCRNEGDLAERCRTLWFVRGEIIAHGEGKNFTSHRRV